MSFFFEVQPGVLTTLTQSITFALPPKRGVLYVDGTTNTIKISNDPAFGISTTITLTNNQAEVCAAFIQCTSGSPVIIFKTY